MLGLEMEMEEFWWDKNHSRQECCVFVSLSHVNMDLWTELCVNELGWKSEHMSWG